MDPHLIETLTEALQRIGQQQQTSIVVPETIRIQPFRGLDGDDVVEWFEVFENRLKRRRIALDSESALTELILHLAGPAKDFYSDLTSEEKDTLENVKRIMIEHYSSKDHGYGQREYLLNRRQAPSETLDHYLTDLCTKFRRLGLTNKEKMTYFLQGLRPEIRQLVYMKEPKTFAEAEKAARFAESISRAPQSSTTGATTERELIAKLLDQKAAKDENAILSKLDVLINGHKTRAGDDQVESLVSKLNGLIEKATSQPTSPTPEVGTASLAAYSDQTRRETPDYMKEIRKIKDSLMDMIQTLDRRVDARINGLARRNQPSREEPPRQRTREGRPICYSCGRVGHVQQNCTERPSRESPSNNDRFQPNMPRHPYSENYLPRSSYSPQQRRYDLPSRDLRDPRIAALNQEPDADLIAPVARNDETNPTASYNAQNVDTVISTPQCAKDTQQHINRPGRKLDARINGIARSIRPRQEANEKYRDHRLRAKPVCYRCGRPGHIQYYCNRNYQSEDHYYSQEDRQVYRTTERTSTLEEEHSLHPERAASPEQLKTSHQENATSTPTLHQKTTPTLTRDQTQIKMRKPNQHTRKTRMSNQMRSVLLPLDTEAYMNPRGLTTNGKIAGKSVHLLVDTGACVSVINEQFLKKTYGDVSLNMSDGPFSSVKTVSGEEVPLLGKITVPLHLNGRQYPCEFHVMQNLAYDAILGRDFLQENRALIDLDNSTITIKDSATQRNQARPTTAPLMGTFIPQGKNLRAEENAFISDAHIKPSPENLIHRYTKNKDLGLSQSLLSLVLIVLYLLATAHMDVNGNVKSVIQKPQSSSAQVSQEGEWHKRYVTDTPAKKDVQIEFDKRIEPNQEEPPGSEVLRFHDLPQKTSNHLQPLPTFGPSRELTY